jgi:hypothetical protein
MLCRACYFSGGYVGNTLPHFTKASRREPRQCGPFRWRPHAQDKRPLQNSVKHKFRSSSFAIVRLEELDEIENLRADAVICYKPVNSQELIAIERIALAQAMIFRGALRNEAPYF